MNGAEVKITTHNRDDVFNYEFETATGNQHAHITFRNGKFAGCQFSMKGNYNYAEWQILGFLSGEIERMQKLYDDGKDVTL